MERTLGLMCGAGRLPARIAEEARRQGWRVVAFTFGDAPGLETVVTRTVPSRITALADVLAVLAEEHALAALFCGKFWLGDVLHSATAPRDPVTHALAARAGALSDRRLTDAVVGTLAGLGIEVLDQRQFLDDMPGPGCWTARSPSKAQWEDVGQGLAMARRFADAGVGQTVVVKRGVVAAVEAVEGTTETVRRGASLAGPGAVVVKAVAPDNDFRFDTPTVGLETVRVAVDGGVAVLAIEAGRVLVLEREAIVALADGAGLAVVGVTDDDVRG